MSKLQQIALFPEIHQLGEVVLPPDRSNPDDTTRNTPDNPAMTKRASFSEATPSNSSVKQIGRSNPAAAKTNGRKKPSTVSIPRGYFGPDDQIVQMLSDVQVASLLSVGRATVWRWTKEDPDFPKPKKLKETTTRWCLNDIIEYINRFVPGASK